MLTDEAKKGGKKEEKEAGLWLWINAGHLLVIYSTFNCLKLTCDAYR